LTYHETARFAHLRPPRTDSNLFSYHLKALLKEDLVRKEDKQYSLSPAGLFYVDRISLEKFEPRLQPKLITLAILTNQKGELALTQRTKQPFIGKYGLPSGKIHLNESLHEAASREVVEKTGLQAKDLGHVGDCYIHVSQEETLISSVYAHVFTGKVIDHSESGIVLWRSPTDLEGLSLQPGLHEILAAVTKGEKRFFAEINTSVK
jgi:ADP-ribose pyrophosphatase YjhB (NUDIX family)